MRVEAVKLRGIRLFFIVAALLCCILPACRHADTPERGTATSPQWHENKKRVRPPSTEQAVKIDDMIYEINWREQDGEVCIDIGL